MFRKWNDPSCLSFTFFTVFFSYWFIGALYLLWLLILCWLRELQKSFPLCGGVFLSLPVISDHRSQSYLPEKFFLSVALLPHDNLSSCISSQKPRSREISTMQGIWTREPIGRISSPLHCNKSSPLLKIVPSLCLTFPIPWAAPNLGNSKFSTILVALFGHYSSLTLQNWK